MLKGKLLPNECVEADDGYGGEDPGATITPAAMRYLQDDKVMRARSIARQRHETGNCRIKLFDVLNKQFRHDIEEHSKCFYACAVLTNLTFRFGKGLFTVKERYNDAMTVHNSEVAALATADGMDADALAAALAAPDPDLEGGRDKNNHTFTLFATVVACPVPGKYRLEVE